MALFASLDPLEPEPEGLSLAELLRHWDAQPRDGAGQSYVYAFRDAAGAIFYVGKGVGDRGQNKDAHLHGRLGYYIANFLENAYAVEMLRSGLTNDDAEALEAWLIAGLGGQLVNWAGNLGSMLTADAVNTMREEATSLRVRAREHAIRGDLEGGITLCRQALSYLSDWERAQHDDETRELERLSATSLAARVDLHRSTHEYVPQAPVLACEVLSDLTRYLCQAGRAPEAKREVEAFTERYPHGSFRIYEFFDHRYGRKVSIAVTKREQATLRRIERALSRGT